ncbi:complex I NDUFA9 subunit family protein [Paracoccus aurantiacus]|uniref:Complex I NDUFA9 subunit family protein n=1 Tax=Paracoccus aurantiacus TaxID=2599412 RepID=A0A5C6RXT9_9RHOB|nr:complex I NDUFA9 subunit family protein [Paracoccus aurantiacus]TXB66440.1 complex I NDUFA9 subunit family protein [Paracoccus aurantiacus]
MSKIVTIYGGSGFVGRQVARQMAKLGWRVRVAVRRPSEALFVRTYGAVGQVEPVPCNIRDETSVRAAMYDADAVVNCVGILVNEGANRFAPVHVEGAGRVARLAADAGITNFVHISALGADAESDSNYLATKAEGERAVLEHMPDAVILRPSFMFGPEGGLYERLASSIGFGPVMPIAGAGTKLQPVYVQDVVSVVEKALLGQVAPGIYELGGPDVVTLREAATETLAATYRRKAVVGVPFWLAGIGAGALDIASMLTGGLLTNRVLTRDQLRTLRRDNVVSADATGFDELGIEPTSAESVIGDYLWRFRPSGQYADMTASAKNLRVR